MKVERRSSDTTCEDDDVRDVEICGDGHIEVATPSRDSFLGTDSLCSSRHRARILSGVLLFFCIGKAILAKAMARQQQRGFCASQYK